MNMLKTHKMNQIIVNVQKFASDRFGAESEYTINTIRTLNSDLKNANYADMDCIANDWMTLIHADYQSIATENGSGTWY